VLIPTHPRVRKDAARSLVIFQNWAGVPCYLIYCVLLDYGKEISCSFTPLKTIFETLIDNEAHNIVDDLQELFLDNLVELLYDTECTAWDILSTVVLCFVQVELAGDEQHYTTLLQNTLECAREYIKVRNCAYDMSSNCI
jgi:hypothetical protein